MRILLYGNGNMGEEIRTCARQNKIEIIPFTPELHMTYTADVVGMYFGKGTLFTEMIRFCAAHTIPLIQASTEPCLPKIPNDCGAVVVIPNTSLVISQTLAMLQAFGKTLADSAHVTIIESHQAAKGSTVSGTALAVARSLGVPPDTVRCVRDPAEQRALGIPEEHLKSHGYHWVIIEKDGVKVRFSLEVHGRSAYAHGAIALAQQLLAAKSAI